MSAPTTELECAEQIRDGVLASPQTWENVALYAMRVTGTGAAFRSGPNEFVWRDPAVFLSDEFVQRCNGVPVIFEHPEKLILNGEEFNDRVVGTLMLPYVKETEVWAIARIYDESTLSVLQNIQLSTSPGVKLSDSDENKTIILDDGSKLLIEAKPRLLCHLAICASGVWDKGQDPSGIDSGVAALTDEEKAAEDKKKADAQAKADADKAEKEAEAKADADFMRRMDAWDKNKADAKAKADAEAEEKKKSDAAAAKGDSGDGDEEERKLKEREKADKAKADAAEATAARAKADAAKEQERMDAEEEEGRVKADAQVRADSVYQGFGQQAKAPMQGEASVAYRARLATPLKTHSQHWKDTDLGKLPPDVLKIAETQIYADAQVAARNPTDIPAGQLRCITRIDEAGRRIKTFVGDQEACWGQFKIAPRKATFVQQNRAV